MAKKQLHYNEAERLYVVGMETFESIAERLGIAERTVRYWAEEGKWAERRAAAVAQAQTTHEKTYALYNKLLDKAASDIEVGKEPSPATLYTLAKLAPLLTRIKQYEDAVAKKDNAAPKGLSDDIVALIEESVLGLKRKEQTDGDAKE